MNANLQEKDTIDLGDERLNRRLIKIIENCSHNPSSSIPATFESWGQTKAVYRLFDSQKVSEEKILSAHYKATIERIREHDKKDPILLIQDTSDLNYATHSAKEELGETHSHIKHGLVFHPTIAVTSTRIPLGTVATKFWTRNRKEEKKESPFAYQRKPIEEKESYRWLASFKLSEEVAKKCPDNKIINVADREADIFEVLSQAANTSINNVFFLVRSSHNRLAVEQHKKLEEVVDSCKPAGQISFLLKGRGESNRKVKQEIKYTKVMLTKNEKAQQSSPIPIWVISAKEISPKKGCSAVNWRLLSTLPIHNFDDAIEALNYYLARWEIEIFFKVLKSGCNIEKVQIKDLRRLINCISVYMIVAWRVMFLTKLGREYPDLCSDLLFSEIEWKAAYAAAHDKRPPSLPPSLGDIMLCIASLGGYLGRKNDEPPGYKTIWRGIQKLEGVVRGYHISKFLT